jgi:hypothetical protein
MDHGVASAYHDGGLTAAITRTLPTPLSVRTTEVCVVFTSISSTRSAISIASELANALAASLTLIQFRPTRYPLQPDLATPDPCGEVRMLVEHLRANGYAINARSFVCRSVQQAIPLAFSPHSLVVIGGRRSWLPTHTERLRRALENAGHLVLFVDGTTRKER